MIPHEKSAYALRTAIHDSTGNPPPREVITGEEVANTIWKVVKVFTDTCIWFEFESCS